VSRSGLPLLLVFLVGCERPPDVVEPRPDPEPDEIVPPVIEPGPPRPTGRVLLTIVGTNDVHGRAFSTPILGGYLRILRQQREADGGAVLLIDGGDMWQGTLESNLVEGEVMVTAYNELRYTAAAIGNHEFDYGPVGPATTPTAAGDDPRGALLARVAQARFPVLNANVLDVATGQRVEWPGVLPSVLQEHAGVKVGIIGVTTEETLDATISGNVRDLRIAPLLDTVRAEAEELRGRGAGVVVLTAHAGGDCDSFEDPDDLSSCDPDEEIFELARALPGGLVDVIVAGHTHAGVAHEVNGIAIIESFAYGYAFGRVDVTYDHDRAEVSSVRIHQPRPLCVQPRPASVAECQPPPYEGEAVVPDAGVQHAIAPFDERAREQREQSLGVRVVGDLRRHHHRENPLANLLTDLMLAARPGADAAVINAGGIRASIHEGELTYGALYETFPFDNRFATLRMRGAELRRLYEESLLTDGGIFTPSGLRVEVRCRGGDLEVTVRRRNGRVIGDDEELTVLMSDFLATGNEPAFVLARSRDGSLVIEDVLIREELARVLRDRGGSIRADDRAFFDPRRRPRLRFPADDAEAPISCAAPPGTAPAAPAPAP
jgi:5'-nucleotidase